MSDDDQELSEYTVKVNGIEHTMMLTAEDAKRYGDDATKGGKSSTKKSTPPNKSGS